MKVDEQQLINRILGGHTEDYAYFLDTYSREVFAFVMRIVIQQEDAEELTQDAFVKAFNHLDSFAGQSAFSTWICRIAYNCAINFFRRKQKNLFSYDEDEKWLNTISDNLVDEALSTDNDERIALLEAAIDKLPPDDKTLVTLFYYKGRSFKEIAYIMGIPYDEVDKVANKLGTRLCRIRKKLYVQIKEMER
ncbi:MAG: RNA polymerase sigma factor [Phocaeicola sp.]|uniref:RNA polymerase sigma factor n=1 Tax=Phocaeicola sp. TaxID=2773926 RepID=UPI003F9F5934